MARTIVYGCFSLLLAGLGAFSIGCVVADEEADEDSDQTENAAVVSSISEGITSSTRR